MRVVERLATYLDILGIHTGKLCPHIFVAEACGHFVTADILAASGTVIPGRRWSVDDLKEAAIAYIGIDVVPDVLNDEMRPGLTVEQYWTQRGHRLLDQAKDDPEMFANAIHEISLRVVEAQRRLSRQLRVVVCARYKGITCRLTSESSPHALRARLTNGCAVCSRLIRGVREHETSAMVYEQEIYDDRGQLLSAVERVGGETEILRSWSKSGVLILEAYTSKGEYNGRYRSWWDNGALKEEGTFASGKRIGIYRWYLESGALWQEVDCDDAL